MEIRGKCTVGFQCNNGDEKVLKDVYYIPTLCSNIVSLGQLSENGKKVILSGDYLWVYDEHRRLIMKVKRSENRLYRIILRTTQNQCLMSSMEESTWLWHSHLGNVNFQDMAHLSEKEMVYGVPKFVRPESVCTGCLLSKQSRKPFPKQTTFQAKHALELIHADLCGPINPATLASNRYFLLLVDDYSKMIWVYMLSSKDEALEDFKKFKALVERNLKRRLKYRGPIEVESFV